MNPIKALLFDKDGTLFDFQKTWGAWAHGFLVGLAENEDHLAELAKSIDYRIDHRRFAPQSVAVAGTPIAIARALAPHLPKLSTEILVARMIETSSAAPLAPPVPLGPLLRRLRASGFVLGVATNDSADVAHAHLEAAGVAHYFDFVTGSDRVAEPKPAPDMVRAFLDHAGTQPQDTVMVGDSTHDLRAGRAAGTRTIAVLTGTATYADLAPWADLVLDHIGQIPDRILMLST